MDLQLLSPQQMEKTFKLCDVMSLEDIFVATTILISHDWNLQVICIFNTIQKAIDQIAYSKQQENKSQVKPLPIGGGMIPQLDQTIKELNQKFSEQIAQHNNNVQKPKQKVNENPDQRPIKPAQGISYYVDFSDEEDPYNSYDVDQEQIDYADYQYEYADNELEKKKKIFEENYVSDVPFNKSLSEPHHMIKELERDRTLTSDYSRHRHQYQNNLFKKSQELCTRILEKNPEKKSLYTANQRKIQTNKKFIVHLHKNYKSKINFTFGTFLLNLIRSHLDNKYLMVFIHHQSQNRSNIVERVLYQPQISQFVNKNCVSYGMFDNSDDYEIIQKYVPLKQLPAFAIFKYNRKDQKEEFISSYVISQNYSFQSILSKQGQNCLEWMAKWMGVALKKKDPSLIKSENTIKSQKAVEYEKVSDLLKDQNLEYEQMEKLYINKRLLSKQNKIAAKQKEAYIQAKIEKFSQNQQPKFQSGKTIEIKLRMPISGESKMRVFNLSDKVQILFDYVECFCQDQFEERYCEFDLTQTFPFMSLKDKQQKTLDQVFEGSSRENIIVKEI